jgi:hypothetical protein
VIRPWNSEEREGREGGREGRGQGRRRGELKACDKKRETQGDGRERRERGKGVRTQHTPSGWDRRQNTPTDTDTDTGTYLQW